MPSTIHRGELVPSEEAAESVSPVSPAPVSVSPVSASPIATSYVSEEESTPSLTLRDFLSILRRRKWVALGAFTAVLALSLLLTLFTRPVYRAQASILVEGRSNALSLNTTNDDPLSSIFQSKQGRDVDTQVEIVRSPIVLDRAFAQAKVSPNSVDVDVRRVDRTDVIQLTATSSSRESALAVARTVPVVYQAQSREDRLRDVSAALAFAQANLKSQTAKLNRAENALETFRQRSGVVSPTDEASAAIKAGADTRSDLQKAEVNVAALEAQLTRLQTERNSLSPFLDSPVTATNPQVVSLREEIASLVAKRQQQSFLYKPNSDEIRLLDSQIASLRQRLALTPPTITTTTRARNAARADLDQKIADVAAQLGAARNSLRPLRSQVASQTSNLSRYNLIARREAELLRNLDASNAAVKSFGTQVLQLTLRQRALEAQGASVYPLEVDHAALKIEPRPFRNLLVGLFLGALLACGAALLQESLDNFVRDEEEARRLLHSPVLGYLPLTPQKSGKPILDLAQPDRNLLEAFRGLRSNIHFTLVNSPGRRLLVTSTVPGEGKSYVASNLAISMAINGQNVILVDADLHRPRAHKAFEVPQSPGLSNVLIGDARLSQCAHDVGIPGLRVIPSGDLPPNPTELLSSAMMDALIERLGRGNTVVIFDSPPLLATTDAQLLSSKMDGVIFVMQLGRTPRSSIERALELLRTARARVLGVVFNQMEAESSQYYQVYNYYSDPEASAEDTLALDHELNRHLSTSRESSNASNGAHPAPSSNGAALLHPPSGGDSAPSDSNGHANGALGQEQTPFDSAFSFPDKDAPSSPESGPRSS